MNLSEIRKLLNDEDIMLTKSLGQTFMHDQNQLRKIVALAKLASDDSVIEIGPGLGPLTGMLLEIVGHVTAIETDRRLIKLLEKQFAKRENLSLQHADAMKIVRKTEFDWSNTSSSPTCLTRSLRLCSSTLLFRRAARVP